MAAAEILPPLHAFAPMTGPIIATVDGLFVPDPLGRGHQLVPMREGVAMGWADTRGDLGRITLAIFAGAASADLGFAIILTTDGLRNMIADLQSIEEQIR